jgi:hypothetical protein
MALLTQAIFTELWLTFFNDTYMAKVLQINKVCSQEYIAQTC